MTALQQLLGLEHPVVQAPMAGVQGSALALAVANAGGLGSLPCALLGLDTMRQELERLRAGTARPYNVNFFCHAPPAWDAARDAAWRQALLPYYRELGVDPASAPAGSGRLPFDDAALELIREFAPPVVSFHFGLPESRLVAAVKAWGGRVMSTATTVEEARWLEAHGADVIIAQGVEAGGHRGMFLTADLATQRPMPWLVSAIVEAVRVPVVAAGGIADADGVAAALANGAAGVQVGTAYLLCREATTSAIHRAALKSAAARTTELTNVFTGRPARGIVNRLIRELGPMSALAPQFPLASAAITPLRSAGEAAGSGDFSPLWAGQNTSGCREVGAADVTRALAGAG